LKNKKGEYVNLVLKDYKVVPDLLIHLFSLTKAIGSGWQIGNQGKDIFIKKNDHKIIFDQRVTTDKGYLTGCELHPRARVANSESVSLATTVLDRGRVIA